MNNTNIADANGVGRKDVYTKVTERIISDLEQGNVARVPVRAKAYRMRSRGSAPCNPRRRISGTEAAPANRATPS